MIVKFDLDSNELQRTVRIHMYLPDDYLVSGQDYPVLYMFDGHNLFFDEDATFGRSWRMLNPLYALPHQIIVVGVECAHTGNDRLIEYAPFPFYDPEFGGWLPAKGRQTMEFMTRTLKPYVDHHFPTRPGRRYTWIAGSSCGGLMAIYGLTAYSSVFSKAAALSPYVLPSYEHLLKQSYHAYLQHPASLFLSWGSDEGDTGHEFIMETKVLADLTNILLKKGVRMELKVVPGGTHCEAEWERLTLEFLRFLL